MSCCKMYLIWFMGVCILADNRFSGKDDFEDIFSNSSQNDKYEDIYSNSSDGDFEDFSSFSGSRNSESRQKSSYTDEDDSFIVKYNSAVQNRRRQQIEFEDVSEVYGDIVPDKKKKAPKRKKRHPIRNTFIVLLCLILVGASCVGFYGYSTVNRLLSLFNTDEPLAENEYISSSELYSDSQQLNILLVGVDAREGETASRSDTMMLVTLDHKNGQIKLTSFLRDSYTQIAGRRYAKLNAAYFYGGIQGLVDTLELNFKVEIPYYAVVDFDIFTTIVDAIGGINVEVTEKESEYTYNSGKIEVPVRIEAGESVHLNGEQALWYSRIRYLDSDFMRTYRQRKVITAIVEKAKQQDFKTLLSLAETIIPLVKTNISSDEMLKFAFEALKNKAYGYEIVQQQIPAEGTWSSKSISGLGSCLVMDMDENIEILRDFLANKYIEEIE